MFGFEKIPIYSKSKNFHRSVIKLLGGRKWDYYIKDQLQRASFSLMLNISEGSGRFINADQRRFLIMARSSLFETVSILDFARDENLLDKDKFKELYLEGEEISKALYSMIRKFKE